MLPRSWIAAAARAAGRPRRQAARTARASIDDRTSGMQKLDGYFPLYWDERTGSLFIEIPRFDTEFLLATGLAAGLGSNDIGLDRGEGGGARIVSFQRVGPRVLLVQPNQSFRSSSANPLERKSVEDSFAKSVLWGFTVAAESERPRARRRDRFPVARRDQRRQRAASWQLPRRPHAQRVLHGAHQGVSEKHRDRDDADLRRTTPRADAAAAAAGRRRVRRRSVKAAAGRRRWRRTRRRAVLRLGRERDADRRRGDAARARLAGRAARQQLHAPRGRSARRLRRPDLRRLQRADRRADADALHPPPSPGEKGSERGGERAGEADSVLGGFGRARGREEGAGRRRELVEPGVRSGRVPQRVQGRRAARRRRPDGHPLQHDQLGPSLDARLELGRHRSPIRAPARSSRRRSRSGRCAIARTT